MGSNADRNLLTCVNCGRIYSDEVLICPICGWLTIFKYSNRAFRVDKAEPGIWRYRSVLPKVDRVVSKGEGLTPVNNIGGVLVKNERYNPTGTYSDRASSVIASYVLSKGLTTIRTKFEEDFTYSLTYYLSGVSSIEVVVGDPLSLDYLDVDILLRAGNVKLIFGENEKASLLGYTSPLTIEGLKTIAFEIYERRLRVERVVVPARTGLLAYSIWKGFRDLEDAGVNASYEVVATSIKGMGNPILPEFAKSIKLVEISRDEAFDSLVKLWKNGVKTKPLSASAYAIAENMGDSVAVVTMGFRPLSAGRRTDKGVRKEIIRILEKSGGATAYEVWKVFPAYSLRGIYKVLESMEEMGEVCSDFKSRGKRKIKYYRVC
ncbi:MAG: hypothetical protein QW290_07330 [Sulfolobales archaeon]